MTSYNSAENTFQGNGCGSGLGFHMKSEKASPWIKFFAAQYKRAKEMHDQTCITGKIPFVLLLFW